MTIGDIFGGHFIFLGGRFRGKFSGEIFGGNFRGKFSGGHFRGIFGGTFLGEISRKKYGSVAIVKLKLWEKARRRSYGKKEGEESHGNNSEK